jgi:hypothetical protein
VESGEETGGSGWQEAGEEFEEEELTAPEQEAELDLATITEEEKQAIPEFFEGRPSKTPERYLKIRNYMLDQWYTHNHNQSETLRFHFQHAFCVCLSQVEE